jgi:signal peptidase II
MSIRFGRLRDFWISGAIVVGDQVSKEIVRSTLQLHESVSLIPGFLSFTHVHNTGAAFGFLNATEFPYKVVVMTLIAVLALVAVGYYALSLPPDQRIARLGLTLILGGAVGNLIDRVSAGYVIDFVDVYWREYHFWAFNVADSAITVGVGLMLLDMLNTGRHVSETI